MPAGLRDRARAPDRWSPGSFDVFDPVVLTVGRIAGGTKDNIIPDDAVFEATLRTLLGGEPGAVRERDRAPASPGIAAAHGLTAEVDFTIGYPVTVNDVDEYAFAQETSSTCSAPTGTDDGRARRWARRTSRSWSSRSPAPTSTCSVCPSDDWEHAADNHSPRAGVRRRVPAGRGRPAGRARPAAAQPLSTRRVSGSGARTATAATWDGSPSSTSASCTGPSSGCSPRQDTRAGCSFGPVTMT